MCKNFLFKITHLSYFLQNVSPYNECRSSKSKNLQGKKIVRKEVEVCVDEITAEAQVVEVKKPVDKHQGQVLEKEGAKDLGHACHHIAEVQYCLVKRQSRFWHELNLICQIRFFPYLQDKVHKCCLIGAERVEDKLLESKKELKSNRGKEEDSNDDVHCERLLCQARQQDFKCQNEREDAENFSNEKQNKGDKGPC